jgi:hypothetical protein
VKNDANPLNPVERLQNAPRCTAHSKRTGKPCKAPAVRGWNVCRFHGAGGGACRGEAHPNYRHGLRSLEVKDFDALVRLLSQKN